MEKQLPADASRKSQNKAFSGPQSPFVQKFKQKRLEESLSEKYWAVFGHGPIGSKAQELMDKMPRIAEAGFELYGRSVLSMGFFDGFRKRNGIDGAVARGASPEEIAALVLKGGFSAEETGVFACILKQNAAAPLAVRSSAHGDCRGTGIYESTMIMNDKDDGGNLSDLSSAVKRVLASEFSKNAAAYRKDLALPGGMAVMIEPVFGSGLEETQRYDEESYTYRFFGPLYGGIAYTGTDGAPAKAYVAGGMPVGAVRGKSVEMREPGHESISGHRDWLSDSMSPFDGNCSEVSDKVELLKKGRFVVGDQDGEAYCIEYDVPKSRVAQAPLSEWLFPKLRKLGEILGKQQYVEFAVREEGGEPKVAILQIAEVSPKLDFYQLAEGENTVMKTTHEVVGSGQRRCEEIIEIWNPDDIGKASRYNDSHKDFAVLYGGRLVSGACGEILKYYHVDNASVLIEMPYGAHLGSIASHWSGALDSANKLLFEAEKIEWDRLDAYKTKQKDGLVIYKVPVMVTASERQRRAVVEVIGNGGSGEGRKITPDDLPDPLQETV